MTGQRECCPVILLDRSGGIRWADVLNPLSPVGGGSYGQRVSTSATPAVVTARENALVWIAVVVTLLAWASAFVVIRGVAPHVPGGALALGRLVVGTVALGVVAVVQRGWLRPTGREWLQIVAYGVAWFGAYNVALNTAEHSLDAGTTAMIVGAGPIIIALGAGLFLGEGIPKWLAIGAGVAFVGVLLIGLATSLTAAQGIDPIGVVWSLVAAVTYTVGVLVQKPAIRRLPASQVTFLGCAIGMIACLPFLGQLVSSLAVAPVSAVLGVVYLGLVPTAVGFSTWAYALQRTPAGRLSVSTYVVPAIAIVLALIFFGEIPAPLAIVGGVICLTGVAISRRRGRARQGAAASTPAAVTVPPENLPE
jgi:drug/metabolite transporter (DMT)-like permease